MTYSGAATTPRVSRIALRALAMIALWTVFGLLWSAPSFLGLGGGRVEGVVEASDHIVPFYWAWALLTPVVLWLARRTAPLSPRGPWLSWALLALAAPIVVAMHGMLSMLVLQVLRVESLPITSARLASYIVRHGGGDLAVYLTLIGGYALVDTARRARDREVVAAALEARLARADLELLRWQLQPHFLFNALNTVSTLVLKQETHDANRAIELIARYLRLALAQRPDATVTVAEELEVVARYAEIEGLRFGGALEVVMHVDADALGVRIPGSLLQPLVENAIRHGAGAREGDGPVVVAGRRAAGRLQLTVSDPGTRNGQSCEGTRHEGFGLRYVRERLHSFYGTDASFSLIVSATGSTAALDLPALRPA